MQNLLDIMRALRDPESGCPWDREQDFRSIAPYTIEEAYEVADAIDRDDLDGLRDELGDLLLQVIYHAQMADELGAFEFGDVVDGIADKLVRRHPHVFGDAEIPSSAAQTKAWEAHKRAERAEIDTTGVLDGVCSALPALTRAQKLAGRAASVGFDWPDAPAVREKLDEELQELREAEAGANAAGLCEELGDVLFTVCNLARHLGVDAEESLRQANTKFTERFGRMEKRAAIDGQRVDNLSAAELDALWDAAKKPGSKTTG